MSTRILFITAPDKFTVVQNPVMTSYSAALNKLNLLPNPVTVAREDIRSCGLVDCDVKVKLLNMIDLIPSPHELIGSSVGNVGERFNFIISLSEDLFFSPFSVSHSVSFSVYLFLLRIPDLCLTFPFYFRNTKLNPFGTIRPNEIIST